MSDDIDQVTYDTVRWEQISDAEDQVRQIYGFDRGSRIIDQCWTAAYKSVGITRDEERKIAPNEYERLATFFLGLIRQKIDVPQRQGRPARMSRSHGRHANGRHDNGRNQGRR
ncbi:MAG TPA: hypothetical protein PKL83_02515 [bacterium]|nr:hypothetical protein [bacterium]